jgi:enamine deaminase RidA (YjgF/YER057c/UK114 family)
LGERLNGIQEVVGSIPIGSTTTRQLPVSAPGQNGHDPDAALAALGITLPPPAKGVSPYEPVMVVGSMLYTSGQLPWQDGALRYRGAIGRDLSLEDGYQSVRLSCINALAQVRHALSGFDRLTRFVRAEGVLYTAPDFDDAPKALDGATDLLHAAFGERGRHTRMIYTQQAMPLGCTSLVILWAEIWP